MTNTLLSPEEIKNIRKEVEREFPHDFALQEVHFSRKILAMEAKKLGVEYLDYIKQLARQIRKLE